MKKASLLLVAVFALLFVSCKQETRLTISPSSATVKINTPTTVNVQYGVEGEGIDIMDIDRVAQAVNSDNGEIAVSWDIYNKTITGYQVGDWHIGVVVCNTPHDTDSGIKYSAYMTVHVTE